MSPDLMLLFLQTKLKKANIRLGIVVNKDNISSFQYSDRMVRHGYWKQECYAWKKF
jgi:hypothetical protein